MKITEEQIISSEEILDLFVKKKIVGYLQRKPR